MGRALLASAIVSVLALFAPAAGAQDVRRGVSLFESAQFERAQRTLERALQAEELTREAATRAHQHLGAIQQILGNEEASRAHAAAAIALDPSVRAPAGAPAFGAVLSAARREQGQMAALRIVAPDSLPAMRDTRIVAQLEPAPPALVDQLVLRCTVGRDRLERASAPPSVEILITPPETATSAHCESEGRTAAGASLFSASLDLDVVMPGDEPWVWVALGAGGAGLIAAAIVIAVVVAVGSGPDGAVVNEPTVVGWP